MILAKRLTKLQKKEILDDFQKGESLQNISQKFGCTKITISRNIKKILGEERFEIIKSKNDVESNLNNVSKNCINEEHNQKNTLTNKNSEKMKDDNEVYNNQFYEIAPINHNIDENFQKDLSSLPIESVELPSVVYMIVDKQIDLCSRPLREYPDWHFLPEEDLDRLTLEIFSDQKYAKKSCTKNQKLIKVPNPNVFLLASIPLKKKGISRIIFDKLLLSL